MEHVLKLEGQTLVNVVPASGAGGGYRVRVAWKPSGEDTFEVLTHTARCTLEVATRLRDRVAASRNLNLDYWTWQPSKASPIAVLQRKPWAAA